MIVKKLENDQFVQRRWSKMFDICHMHSFLLYWPSCIISDSQSFLGRLWNLVVTFSIQFWNKSKVTAILWPSRKGLAVTKIFLLTRKKWFLSNFSTLTWWPAKILIEARCLSRSLFNSAGHFSSLNTHTAAPPPKTKVITYKSRGESFLWNIIRDLC